MHNVLMHGSSVSYTCILHHCSLCMCCRIHSRYKADIADRLVLGALNVAYQQSELVYEGPKPLKYAVHRSNKSLLLHLQATGIEQRTEHGFEVMYRTVSGAGFSFRALFFICIKYQTIEVWCTFIQ